MDRIDLKALICLLRESGLTFSKISEELKNKYGIQMSRQAVCSSYKRSLKQSDNNKEMIRYTNDILHYHLIGLSHKEIVKIIDNPTVTIQKIIEILETNKKSLQLIRDTQLECVIEHINLGLDLISLKIKLAYNGIYPKDKYITKILNLACDRLIENDIKSRLAKIVNISNDSLTIAYINKKYNLKISKTDLYKHINKLE